MAHDVRIETYGGPRNSLRALFELAEDSAAELGSYIGAGRVLVAVSGCHHTASCSSCRRIRARARCSSTR